MSHFEKVSFEIWSEDMKKSGIKGISNELLRKWYDEIKLPMQATTHSAGCDIFMPYCFNHASKTSAIIPTGIRWVNDIDNCSGKVLLIFPRSGLGFKHGIRLSNTVGVVDEDYCISDNQGHILVSLYNPSDSDVYYEKGKAFSQAIIVKYEIPNGAESSSSRNGGFGSTDTNEKI